MTSSRWRRAGRVVAVALTAAAVAAVGSSFAPQPTEHADYCAIMPDSVGLYAGNPVTQMGYQIGKVKAVTPSAMDVRVDFTVTEPRLLPADVKAIIRSPSILADRALELVGNYESGPQLPAGGCIPLARSSTPKSLSEVIGSATNFVNSINPKGSTNVGDVVSELDQSLHNKGAGIQQLLTTSSAVLNNPDQAVADIGSIIVNLSKLTSVLTDIRGPLKEVMLDAQQTTGDIDRGANGARRLFEVTVPIISLVSELETGLGQELQFTLDEVSLDIRKISAHSPRIANVLNVAPWWINTEVNIINDHLWQMIRYRPPLYRIRTPDGVALCNILNASMQGSCANVSGQPYAVDVALLQYVLNQAAHR